jgi:hypothetical protein
MVSRVLLPKEEALTAKFAKKLAKRAKKKAEIKTLLEGEIELNLWQYRSAITSAT